MTTRPLPRDDAAGKRLAQAACAAGDENDFSGEILSHDCSLPVGVARYGFENAPSARVMASGAGVRRSAISRSAATTASVAWPEAAVVSSEVSDDRSGVRLLGESVPSSRKLLIPKLSGVPHHRR